MIEGVDAYSGFSGLTAGGYLLIALATFAASLVSGIGGFGGGMVLAIAVSPLVGPKMILPLISVFAFFSNVSRAVVYRRTIDWRRVLLIIAASVPGLALGVVFYDWAPERVILVLLGLTLIASIPMRRALKRRDRSIGHGGLAVFGLVFGFVSGTALGSGMIIIAGLVGSGLQGPMLLGTDAVIGLLNSALRVGAFRSLDLLPNDIILAGAVMGVMTFPGTLVARAIVERMGLSRHTVMMEGILITGGLYFLWRAITG